MAWLNPILIAVSLLSIGGGVQGFVAAKSTPSLIGGVGIGLVIIVGMLLAKSKPMIGHIISLVGCLALAGRFLPKAISEGQLWPAMAMGVAGAIGAAALGAGHFIAKKQLQKSE